MFAEVLLIRSHGRQQPRWQQAAHSRTGKLSMVEERCATVNRVVRTARLTDSAGRHQLLWPLRDAQALAIAGDVLTLTGFEALPDLTTDRLYQQTWLCRILAPRDFEAWAKSIGASAPTEPPPVHPKHPDQAGTYSKP